MPINIIEEVKLIQEALGLVFGEVDYAVTAKGEYYFFEVNPNGQWLWMQVKANLPIAKTLAKLLAEGKSD